MKSSKYIPNNEDVHMNISDQRHQKQKSLVRNKKKQRDRLANFHLSGMCDHLQIDIGNIVFDLNFKIVKNGKLKHKNEGI